MTTGLIADLLSARRMIPRLRARDKHRVVRVLAKCLAHDRPATEDAIMNVVADCADYPVFGPDTGVVLLHAAVAGLETPLAAVARLDPAIDFGALDGQPTDIAVLLVSSPERASLHLRALACLARRLRCEDIRRRLRGVEDPDSMYAIMADEATAASDIAFVPEVARCAAATDHLKSLGLERTA